MHLILLINNDRWPAQTVACNINEANQTDRATTYTHMSYKGNSLVYENWMYEKYI